MGLLDVLNGMQNGPRGQRDPNHGGGGMSPITMAILAVLVLVMGFAVPRPAAQLVAQATAIILDKGDPVAVAAPWQFLNEKGGDTVASLPAQSSNSETNP